MIQPAFASSPAESLKARAQEKKLADDPYWHRLLHYRRTLWTRRYQSEIHDPTFFLSANGRRSPAEELDATLIAFYQPAPTSEDAQHAICRFPARYEWLHEKLEINPATLPTHSCARFEAWRGQLAPESVSLVFASSYMNNPSSMYGHTFILLKKNSKSGNDFLDYVVNFAADLEGDNGIMFAVKGLIGGYDGRFSSFPYYMKVQEYARLESRDLWEYDLAFSSAATRRLVQHLWELGNVRIPYYFLNKNCSYYLLPVFEVADPDRHLKDQFWFKAIPVDTARASNLSSQARYRPSHATLMLHRRGRLTPDEIPMVEHIVEKSSVIQSREFSLLLPERQALVLDSAQELFRYRIGFSRDQADSVKAQEHDMLVARSKLPPLPQDLPTGGYPPHLAHKTGRVMLSHGFSNRTMFEELSLRPAIHDQEDDPQGYLPGSKLEMFHLKLRYHPSRRVFYVKEFSVIDMFSMTPYDRWIHPPSWKVQSGLGSADDLDRDPEHSLYYGLNLGTGYSAWLNSRRNVLVFGMAEMTLQLGTVFEDTVRFGGGPSGGLLFTPVEIWRMRFVGSYFPYAVGGTPSTVRLGLYQSLRLSRSFDARLKLERANHYKEILLSVAYFL